MTRVLFVIAVLMLTTLTACSEPPQREPPASTTPAPATPTVDQASSMIFPQHEAPLGTDSGGEYFAGRLVINERCLRAEAPSRDAAKPRLSTLLIWPRGFALETELGTARVVDGLGQTVAHVGDHVRLSRASVAYQQAKDQGWIEGLAEDCEGPHLMVGDEVTAFDPKNEATEIRLSDPEVLLLRRKTVQGFPTLPQALGLGEVILDGQCLRLNASEAIVWPAGFTPHVDRGVVQVRNGAGRVIATVGDEIAAGGAYYSLDNGPCPGPAFSANQIKVLPDVEVYFPKQDGTLTTEQEIERYSGKLLLDGKCLVLASALRIRDRALMPVDPWLIWPSTFSLGFDDGNIGILDNNGREVAKVGDEIQLTAFDLTYEQAVNHGGLDQISPACSGPYWAVGEDFAASTSQAP